MIKQSKKHSSFPFKSKAPYDMELYYTDGFLLNFKGQQIDLLIRELDLRFFQFFEDFDSLKKELDLDLNLDKIDYKYTFKKEEYFNEEIKSKLLKGLITFLANKKITLLERIKKWKKQNRDRGCWSVKSLGEIEIEKELKVFDIFK